MDEMYIAYSWIAVSMAALAGFWLHLHYRRRDRTISAGVEAEQLEAHLRSLHQDVEGIATEMRDRLAEMEERLDFSERLLTQLNASPRQIAPEADRLPTPV